MFDTALASRFASLHVPGTPLILYNAWDAVSAKAVAQSGASAIATASTAVSAAYGFGDSQELPMELALENAARVARAVDLPVTIDFEGAYAADPKGVAANLARLAETGAVGCNFEDQVVGGQGLHSIDDQVARIRAARDALPDAFFLNLRTDIFLQAKPETHGAAMVDQALERANAYAEAGANGFFVPGLKDLDLLERVCSRSPLPVNYMYLPGGPSNAEIAATGIARISYGPFAQLDLMAQLTEAARAALS
jgi:2-methylisocitrate lyase-like PEP mutase family enzyme